MLSRKVGHIVHKTILILSTMAIVFSAMMVVNVPKVYACYTWEIGQRVGIAAGTEIREGPGFNYPPYDIPSIPDNWLVDIIDGPRQVDGVTWWDISRENIDGGGTGWIYIEQAGYDVCGDSPGQLELVDDLSLRSDSGVWPPQVNDKLIAHIKVRNTGDQSLHVEHIGVRGWRNGNEKWDIGFWKIDLDGHEKWSLDPNNEKPLQEGSYSFRISYSLDGDNWTEIGNEINFTVSSTSSKYSISGQVHDNANNLISGVTISDNAGHTATTDSNGNYTLSELPANEYTITPSKNGCSFSPGSRSVTVPPNIKGQDFTATCQVDTYTISGHVSDESGNPISNVTISDDKGHTTTTDNNGNYSLEGLAADTYTITPSHSSYTFSPASHNVKVPPDTGDNDFTATPVPTLKPWTLMFYFAADNDLEEHLIQEYDQLSRLSNNSNVNIIAFWDGKKSEANWTVFSPDGNIKTTIEEPNTGDPSTLRDFLSWSISNYPAKHYALIISDHGHGLSGTAYDYHPKEDHLTPKEISKALSTIEKLDILYMDACLMATIESGYQLRSHVDYYVASESISWTHLNYFIEGNKETDIPPITEDTSPKDLAVAIARNYVIAVKYKKNPEDPDYPYPSTISVAQLSNAGNVVVKASNLAKLLRKSQNIKSILDYVKDNVQRFEENSDKEITPDDRIVDLYHFAELVESRVDDTNIKNAAQQLKEAIDNYIIYKDKWSGQAKGYPRWDHENSYGVSIYFPPPNKSTSFYSGDWLDFATGTNWWHNETYINQAILTENTIEWGPMLVDYIYQSNPDAPDDPNPPELQPLLIVQDTSLPNIHLATGTLSIGQTTETQVTLENADNLYGADLRLTFDPSIVQVVDADPNTPGDQIAVGELFSGQDNFIARNWVDNANGIIEFIVSLRDPAPSINGNGTMASITWLGINAGQSQITLESSQLAAPSGDPIAHNVTNGVIDVSGGNNTPVSGEILLQGRNDHSGIQVYLSEEACPTETSIASAAIPIPDVPSAVTDAAGNFEITPYPGKTYQCMQAVYDKFLIAQASSPDGNLGTVTLPCGDMNGDGVINVFDLAFIASHYGESIPVADINEDNRVNVFDLTIVASNYGLSGPITDWH